MIDNSFSDLLESFIRTNIDKCPDLLLPNFRIIPAEPPFPSGKHYIGYERLDLKVFLAYLYPNHELHTTSFSSESILADLKKKHSNFSFYDTFYFFQTFGELTEFSLTDLQYYQDEIDLRGRNPRNGNMDEPILVVQYSNGIKVIYNGYHRACFHILTGRKYIKAYLLKV